MPATTIQQFNLLIDGKISSTDEYFNSINPSTGEVFARVANATDKDMYKAIVAARKQFDRGVWPSLSIKERGQYLVKIANAIREHAKELAELESLNAGKTLKQSTFIDVPTCADTFEYFGTIESLNDVVNSVPQPVKSITTFAPLEVVGCIIPWNYPLIMTAWKIAPALIAGNTVVFKPSSTASVSVLKLAEIINSVGLPSGVVNFISTNSSEVTKELLINPDVDMISFTGGTKTGQEIMRLASKTTKKVSLELGGKSPNIVFADCDFEVALGGTMSAIFMNQGQMCTAGSRLILEDKIYDKFISTLVERVKKLRIGNALSYETDFGPLVSEQQRLEVMRYVEIGQNEGAKLVCGGTIPKTSGIEKGFYFEPTIFTDVNNSMTIAQEEIFGPVLCVLKFSTVEEAISIANDSKYGLASSVWTKDLTKANDVAKKLQTGTVWINTYGGFYNEAAFGGVKQSGFGRELGREGLIEYTNVKHVCIDQTPGGTPLVSSWF